MRAGRFDRLLARKGRPALLYDEDGYSGGVPTRVGLTDAGAVRMLGTSRGELVRAHLPAATPARPGQVLYVPDAEPPYFLVVKRLIGAWAWEAGPMLALFVLPLELLAQRPVQPLGAALGGYDEPALRTGSTTEPLLAVEQASFRAGLSNDYDPLNETATGPLPAGLLTAYCPPGSTVHKDDTVRLDEQPYLVQTANLLVSNGEPYARQLILAQSGGPGWPLPPPLGPSGYLA